MATPDKPELTPTGALDDERARLRKAGFTDDRIDAFLKSSAVPQASQTAASFAGRQAPMSGAVGNVSAAIGYAQGVIPAVQKEMATAGDRGAPAIRRLLAFGALVLIAAVVVAIGYGISLELSLLRNQAGLTEQQEKLTRDQRGTFMADVIALEIKEADEVRAALHAGRYADGYTIADLYFGRSTIGEGPVILSWAALLDRKYPQALAAAEEANPGKHLPSCKQHFSLSLEGCSDTAAVLNLAAEANEAHALMLLGRTAEAKAIYLTHKDETIDGKTWARAISEDFGELRKAGIAHPMMAEIETALKATP